MLRHELFCDGFQFLPETGSLVPVFQLLLKYPDLCANPARRKLVALLMLKLLLAELPQRELMRIASGIRETNSLTECVDIIDGVQVDKLGEERLSYSNSLQDRYVLLLYWLERKHNATDFQYEQVRDTRHRLPAREVLINAECDPEKQHIVPYSKLREAYGITGRGRTSSHTVNNIGNITYISRALNHFETGLGDQPLDFGLELERSPSNLASHFLTTNDGDKAVLDTYKRTKELLGKSNQAKQRKAFERFCRARRELIQQGFRNWIVELRQAAEFEESLETRTEPVPQLFTQSNADQLRALDYHNLVEDELLRLVALRGIVKPSEDSGWLGGCLRANDRKRRIVFRLYFKPDHMDLRLAAANPTAQRILSHPWFETAFGVGPDGRREKESEPSLLLDCSVDGAIQTMEILHIVIETLEVR